MWLSKKKYSALEKRVAALENFVQRQQTEYEEYKKRMTKASRHPRQRQ